MKPLVVVKAEYTLADCISFYEKYGICAIVNDGVLIGFAKERTSNNDEKIELMWLNRAI